MLLRRVTEHLKSQNWVAVGLDLLVVIVGVVLGLQVNQWDQARQRQAREGAALVRLHDEAVNIVNDLRDRVATFEAYISPRTGLSQRCLMAHGQKSIVNRSNWV